MHFEDLKLELCDLLASQNTLSGVTFLPKYSEQKLRKPLLSPMVTVGLSKISAQDSAFLNLLGKKYKEGKTFNLFGKSVEVELELIIFSISAEGEESCDSIFSALADFFFFSSQHSLSLKELSTLSMGYNRDIGAFELKCLLRFSQLATKEAELFSITDIELRRDFTHD